MYNIFLKNDTRADLGTKITLLIFFILLFIFSFFGYLLAIKYSAGSTPLMWSPGLAAIITYLIRKKSVGLLGWNFGEWKYQWLSYATPLAYVFISYSIIWSLALGGVPNVDFLLQIRQQFTLGKMSDHEAIIFQFIAVASIGLINVIGSVLGEELGWRGLLAVELSKFMRFEGVALAIGIIWSMWHWPLIFFGVVGVKGGNVFYQLFFFSLLITAMTVIMIYIRFKTHSVWPAAVFHASHNLFIQKFFTPLTIQYHSSYLYIDETGAVLAIVVSIFAVFFLKKGCREFN